MMVKNFVVEWRKVQLRGQGEEGPFTFQVSLFKNGDIALVYKDVPMPVANISDDDHPVKCGISDAYLYEHAFTGQGTLPPKRVIYEYHRIEIPPSKIVSNSVVFLEAQPSTFISPHKYLHWLPVINSFFLACILFSSCETCSNATLKHFSCSWCHAKKKHDGPFCTDQGGLHRRRQHWAENNCTVQGKNMYCSNNDENELEDDDSSTSTPGKSSSPDDVIPLDKNKNSDGLKGRTEGSGYAALVFLLGCSLCLIGWLAYAYYNPHTTSGQLMIKYRPSRWRVPSSHVRYSASVHM
uniref:PSI domain-containing protein n=1 Tax=Heterorhabditis bacteriophora TaxID=37862 RepID=A0A1I7XSL0_HETBA